MYARQYASHASCPDNETIQLVRDFKHSPHASPDLLERKKKAIGRFAEEICTLLDGHGPWFITWIPTSKACDDPDYDDRFEQVLKLVAAHCENVKPVSCFKLRESRGAVHSGQGNRNPQYLKSMWTFEPPDTPVHRILVHDDVVTSGASMRAAFDIIKKNLGKIPCVGLAWAMTKADYPYDRDQIILKNKKYAEQQLGKFESMLQCPEYEMLRTLILTWTNAFVLGPAEMQPLPTEISLEEAKQILADRVVAWKEEIRQKGYIEGVASQKSR